MKPSRSLLLLAAATGLLALPGARAVAATVDPIIAPPKRLEALDRARATLAQKEAPDKVANPFYSESFSEVLQGGGTPRPAGDQQAATSAVTPAVNKTARGLLESIASSLRPSGYFVIGGQPTLVFGQKRVKAGGTLTINFEGKEYTLEVIALDRTNFTLRLDREEFTRPIK